MSDPARGAASDAQATSVVSDRFTRDTFDLVQRLSRRPAAITPDSQLMADLGFDSLQVLELVGELEDHFNIAVPLNSLTHIRTVGEIAAEVRRIASEGASAEP